MTPTSRRTLHAALVGLLFFLSFSTWAFVTPRMGVPDEPAHTIKAASLWQGELRGRKVHLDSGNPLIPIPISMDRVQVPESYAELPGVPACFAFQPYIGAGCAPSPGTDMTPTKALTAAGSYPPLYYVLVGWPSRFVGADVGVYLMRLTSAAVCALMIAIGFHNGAPIRPKVTHRDADTERAIVVVGLRLSGFAAARRAHRVASQSCRMKQDVPEVAWHRSDRRTGQWRRSRRVALRR